MRLTQENAHLYEGKILDANNRLFHHYPLRVKRNKLEELMCVDSTDTYMPIPGETDLFNAFHFDFIVDELKH